MRLVQLGKNTPVTSGPTPRVFVLRNYSPGELPQVAPTKIPNFSQEPFQPGENDPIGKAGMVNRTVRV